MSFAALGDPLQSIANQTQSNRITHNQIFIIEQLLTTTSYRLNTSGSSSFALFSGTRETLADVLPVRHLPNRIHIVWSHVLVLQIVCVLPNVNAEQRNQAGRRLQWIL